MAEQLSLKPLPPKEAIAYFRKKGLKKSFAWQDVWQEEHAKAFTVAKAMRSSILQDIRDGLDDALAKGTTLKDFREALQPKLEAQGWWGRQEMTDPLTGETREVQLGSPRRLRTIFDVNMRVAYADGRWERIQDTKEDLPYLRYQTVGDDHVRPEHQAWDGTTLPVDDVWWDSHYPPCDWGCRCTPLQVTQREADQTGGVTDRPAAFPMRSYTNPRTGEVVRVEGGIGPGWGYNPGKAYLDRDMPSPMGPPDGDDGEGGFAASSALDRRVLEHEMLLPADVTRDEAIAAFLGGFGIAPGSAKVVSDPSGDGLVVGQALFNDSAGKPVRLPKATLRALQLVGLALREPAEIRRAWRFGPDGASLLVRRYISRYQVENRPIDVAVDWGIGGWWPGVSTARALNLDALRTGVALDLAA